MNIALTIQLTRTVGNQLSMGTIPQKIVSLVSASDLIHTASQVVGYVSEESLSLGDVTDEAMCVIFNEDDTNFIEVGYGSFTAFIKIPPGELCILPRVSSLAAVKVQADTADVIVTVALFKIS